MMFYKFASKTIVFQETLHNFEKLLFFVTLEKLLWELLINCHNL
jgi:hypothetical protein